MRRRMRLKDYSFVSLWLFCRVCTTWFREPNQTLARHQGPPSTTETLRSIGPLLLGILHPPSISAESADVCSLGPHSVGTFLAFRRGRLSQVCNAGSDIPFVCADGVKIVRLVVSCAGDVEVHLGPPKWF